MRRRRDPRLFEYAGNNTYRARVFPIQPRGERRIQITPTPSCSPRTRAWSIHLPAEHRAVLYPAGGETVVNVTITPPTPSPSVYCPSHNASITKTDRHHASVSYEENDTRPDRDLQLYYTVAQDEIGAHILTYKERGQDGFFMLLAAPSVDQEADPLPKDVVFVLDRSGSMSGEKIEQARDALTFCVNQLGSEDLFEIITFSDNIRSSARS